MGVQGSESVSDLEPKSGTAMKTAKLAPSRVLRAPEICVFSEFGCARQMRRELCVPESPYFSWGSGSTCVTGENRRQGAPRIQALFGLPPNRRQGKREVAGILDCGDTCGEFSRSSGPRAIHARISVDRLAMRWYHGFRFHRDVSDLA